MKREPGGSQASTPAPVRAQAGKLQIDQAVFVATARRLLCESTKSEMRGAISARNREPLKTP
jgi:hypothetical protein